MMRATAVTLSMLFVASATLAQNAPEAPSGQKTLAATMNVYVFPNEGQNAEQQSKHEAECYSWAVKNTGTDPFELAKRAEQQAQQADMAREEVSQAGKGAGARGAVGGAAAGALIGGIVSHDAGKGAAIGATTGLVAGRRGRRRGQNQASAQIDQQEAKQQAATAQQIENFKKAFAVCLEAKEYMVRL